jgi:hypothetical protein
MLLKTSKPFTSVIAVSFVVLTLALATPTASGADLKAPADLDNFAIQNSKTFVSGIHQIFFCETATCKSSTQQTLNPVILESDVDGLRSSLNVLKSSRPPASQRAIVKKFLDDASLLISSVDYKGSNTKIAAETTIGTIYFTLANLQSDIYVDESLKTGKPLNFRFWDIGVVATMYQISQDQKQILANRNSVSAAVSFENNEVTAGEILESDANGPNATFNRLVKTLASNGVQLAKQEILYVQGKLTNLTSSQLSALNSTCNSDWNKVAALQNELAS